jgi:type IV fimbrial biogenesis protein FimT
MRHTQYNAGFTLIELMIVLSIAAILASIAVPSFQWIMSRTRLSTQSNDLITALSLARSEAVKRGVRVTVCKSSSGTVCTTGGDFRQGWIVFVDGDTAGTLDGTDALLRTFGAIQGSTFDGGANFGKWISYLPSGRSRGDTGLANGTFSLCNDHKGRSIVVNTSGRVSVQEVTSC